MRRSLTHIVMLGLMGAGKTTVGRALGEVLSWPVTDSDGAIERRYGATVRELKARLGTDGMHDLEAEHLLTSLAETRPSIICAAASVVDTPDCRQALEADSAYGIWLQLGAETLARRFGSGPHRPVFGSDAEAVFREQLMQRRRWFAEVARQRVSVDGRTPEEIVSEILPGLRAAGVV